MQSLNEIFDHARDYGHPEAQAIVNAWDRETDTDPMTVIEKAESDDLREQIAGYEKITDDLEEKLLRAEERLTDYQAALEQLRWSVYGAHRRYVFEFDDSTYDFFQEEAAQEAVREFAPDLFDDIVAAFIKVTDGEVEEVWGSRSFSSTATFERIY